MSTPNAPAPQEPPLGSNPPGEDDRARPEAASAQPPNPLPESELPDAAPSPTPADAEAAPLTEADAVPAATVPSQGSAPMPPSQPPAARPSFGQRVGNFFREVIYTLLLSFAFYLLLNTLTARIRVYGYSMVPTFRGGEWVLVNRLAYRFGRMPQRGDIVVFHPNNGSQEDYIKRVIGLPGDEILIQNGTIFINNRPLRESYVTERPRYSGYWRVPEGHVFVLGDNRNHSTDSHTLGPVPMDRIIGRAVLIYWPPQRMRLLRARVYEEGRYLVIVDESVGDWVWAASRENGQ